MLASYAVIMRRSAVVTAPAAVAMVVLSTILGGAKGLAGSLLGVALVIMFFVARLSGTTAFNGKLFGLTAIVCVLTWTTTQVLVSARLKVPYVEPDGKR